MFRVVGGELMQTMQVACECTPWVGGFVPRADPLEAVNALLPNRPQHTQTACTKYLF